MSALGSSRGVLLVGTGEEALSARISADLLAEGCIPDEKRVKGRVSGQFIKVAIMADELARSLIETTPFRALSKHTAGTRLVFGLETPDMTYVDQAYELDEGSFGLPCLAAAFSAYLDVPLKEGVILTGCLEKSSSEDIRLRPIEFESLKRKYAYCREDMEVERFFYPEFNRSGGAGMELEKWRAVRRGTFNEFIQAGFSSYVVAETVPQDLTLAYALHKWFTWEAVYERMGHFLPVEEEEFWETVRYLLEKSMPATLSARAQQTRGQGRVCEYPRGIGQFVVETVREHGLKLRPVPKWAAIARASDPRAARDLFSLCHGVSEPSDVSQLKRALSRLLRGHGVDSEELLQWIKLGLVSAQIDELLEKKDQEKVRQRLERRLSDTSGRVEKWFGDARDNPKILIGAQAGPAHAELDKMVRILDLTGEVCCAFIAGVLETLWKRAEAIGQYLDGLGPACSAREDLWSAFQQFTREFGTFNLALQKVTFLNLMINAGKLPELQPRLQIFFSQKGSGLQEAKFVAWPNKESRRQTVTVRDPVLLYEKSAEQSRFSKPEGYVPADDTFAGPSPKRCAAGI